MIDCLFIVNNLYNYTPIQELPVPAFYKRFAA